MYLRARYYDPALSTFTALDPFEGLVQRPMSLNGYSWVEGNPVVNTDASGMLPQCDCQCSEFDPSDRDDVYDYVDCYMGCIQQLHAHSAPKHMFSENL